jgi:ubiquitin-conjugating enzyme E2 W
MNGRRLAKELDGLRKNPSDGVLGVEVVDEGKVWLISFSGPEGSPYSGETFALRFIFPPEYPLESPIVVFVKDGAIQIPQHPHVYTNGHICLSILYDQWSPALTAGSVTMSVISMLASSPGKELPEDNDRYVRGCKSNPKLTRWVFHDDTC